MGVPLWVWVSREIVGSLPVRIRLCGMARRQRRPRRSTSIDRRRSSAPSASVACDALPRLRAAPTDDQRHAPRASLQPGIATREHLLRVERVEAGRRATRAAARAAPCSTATARRRRSAASARRAGAAPGSPGAAAAPSRCCSSRSACALARAAASLGRASRSDRVSSRCASRVQRRAAARCCSAPRPAPQAAQQSDRRRRRQFGRRGRRRRAQVGGEVGQRDVGLVADAADHRQRQPAIARTTRSSLKAHRSSSEPPPRQTISTSTSARRGRQAIAVDQRGRRLAALHQARVDDQLDLRRAARERVSTSCSAAPPSEVTTPTRARKARQRRACARRRTGPRPRAWPSAAGTARTARRRRRAASPRRRTAVRRAARTPPGAHAARPLAVGRAEVEQAAPRGGTSRSASARPAPSASFRLK